MKPKMVTTEEIFTRLKKGEKILCSIEYTGTPAHDWKEKFDRKEYKVNFANFILEGDRLSYWDIRKDTIKKMLNGNILDVSFDNSNVIRISLKKELMSKTINELKKEMTK